MRVRHIKSGKEGVVVGSLDSRIKVRYDSGACVWGYEESYEEVEIFTVFFDGGDSDAVIFMEGNKNDVIAFLETRESTGAEYLYLVLTPEGDYLRGDEFLQENRDMPCDYCGQLFERYPLADDICPECMDKVFEDVWVDTELARAESQRPAHNPRACPARSVQRGKSPERAERHRPAHNPRIDCTLYWKLPEPETEIIRDVIWPAIQSFLSDAGKCNQSPPMSQSGGWYCTDAPDKDGKSSVFHAYYVNMEAMKMTWFEKYNTLADAIKDISKAGWNSGNLFRQGFIITDNERKIIANGIYISNPNLSDDPVLFWVMVDKGVVGMISKDYAEQISGL